MKYLRKVTSAAEIVDPKLDKPSVFFDFTNKVIKCFKKYAEPTKYTLTIKFIDQTVTTHVYRTDTYSVAAGEMVINGTFDMGAYKKAEYFSPDELTVYENCHYELRDSEYTITGTMPSASLYIIVYVTVPTSEE